MWPFKLTLTDEGIENALKLSKNKFYLFPTLPSASPGFLVEAYRLNTDTWDVVLQERGESFRNYYVAIPNNVNFRIGFDDSTDITDDLKPLTVIDPNDSRYRTHLAYALLLQDPLTGLNDEQKEEIRHNQTNIFQEMEERLFNSRDSRQIAANIRKLYGERHLNQPASIETHTGEEAVLRQLLPIDRAWVMAVTEWRTDYLGSWLLYHPQMEHSPLAKEWEPRRLLDDMNAALKDEKIYSEAHLWERIYHRTDVKKTPGQIKKLMTPLISQSERQRLSEIFDENAGPSSERQKIKAKPIDPNAVAAVNDARIEFFREAQGGVGSGSSSGENPYKADPKHARPHGFRQKKFTPK